MSAGLVFYKKILSSVEFKNKTNAKDLTTALSGLSQAEIAKIKSVLDRDQEKFSLYGDRKTTFQP